MRLAGSGQRYTSTRRRLVEILANAANPLSLPDIVRGRRNLPQSSAYRNLAELESAGLVRRDLIELDLTGRDAEVAQLTGEPVADLLLPNDGDLTFCKLHLDPRSLETVKDRLRLLADIDDQRTGGLHRQRGGFQGKLMRHGE